MGIRKRKKHSPGRLEQENRLSRLGRAVLAIQRLTFAKTLTENEINKLLQLLVDIIYLELGYSNCQLFLTDPTATFLEYKYGTGYLNDTESKRELIRNWRPPLNEEARLGRWGIIGWVATQRQAVNVPDVLSDSRYFNAKNNVITRSELTVPLIFNQQLIGVLDIQSEKTAAFDAYDEEIIQFFASQAAQVVHTAYILRQNENNRLELSVLTSREQTARRVAQSLLKSIQLINSQLELEAVLSTISREVADVLNVPVCNILLYDAARQRVTDVVNYGMRFSYDNLLTYSRQTLAAQAALTGQLQKAFDLQQIPVYSNHPVYLKENWHGSIAIPIKPALPSSPVIGVLSVHDYIARDFGSEEVEYLQGLSAHAAVAISNARNYVELKRERDMYRALLDNAHDPIILIRPLDGRILDANQRAAECSGFSYEELLDRPIFQLFAAYEENKLHQIFSHTFSSLAVENIEALRKDGTLYPASFSARLVSIGQEKIIIQIMRDMSQQRAIEQQLTRHEQLRALGQLASGVAHDFNNLLTGILGISEILLTKIQEGEERNLLQMLRQTALDGGHIVRRLQLMRPTQATTEFSPVEVNQVLRDVLELTRPRWKRQAQESGYKYEVELDIEAIPPVQGNASELREVLINLVLNAFDAMPTGGTLKLSSCLHNHKIYLTVEDSGQGMNAETLKHLFEPFFTTKGSSGHGLGLSVSNSIIARHGGTIEVESELNRGSRFTIILPASEQNNISEEKKLLVEVERLNILVLDDEPGLLYILSKILQSDHHKVTPLRTGREALEIFRRQPTFFDLVFTDLSLQDMNGSEVIQQLRLARANIPIVVVTGWISDSTQKRLHELQVTHIITKPYRIEDVREAVQKAAGLPQFR